MLEGPLSRLPAWNCPTNSKEDQNPLAGKYLGRSCDQLTGSWGQDVSYDLRCIAEVVAEKLDIKPGNSLLDWGSGCGWMLTWLHLMYGAIPYGIEGTKNGHDWSSRHSAANVCLWFDLDLSWVPDSSFDHVISNWALYHIRTPNGLCFVASQLVRKLRVGGRAWFGGNDPESAGIFFTPFPREDWMRCISQMSSETGRSFDIEFVYDHDLFLSGTIAKEPPSTYLYLKPVYSVFVVRTG